MNGKNSKRSTWRIEDKEFCADFNAKRWTVEWNWTVGSLVLKNSDVLQVLRAGRKESEIRTKGGEVD